jgi:ribonuclease HI
VETSASKTTHLFEPQACAPRTPSLSFKVAMSNRHRRNTQKEYSDWKKRRSGEKVLSVIPSNPRTTLHILFDGGCRGIKGYGSFRVGLNDSFTPIERRVFEGRSTCNTAEWNTLIEAIRYCLEATKDDSSTYFLDIKGDSTLVINQLNQRWDCHKEHLRKLRDEALDLLKAFNGFRALWQTRVVSVRILGH